MAVASDKPNIVFVFADQMRASALGCAGIEDVATPNLDAFAGQGTRFTRAISNTPVCSPARASIITGLHTMTHELVFNDIPLRTDLPTLARCLNGAGYRCGYVGKWHMDCPDRGVFTPPGAKRQGFDDYWAAYNCNHDYFRGYYYLNDNPAPVWIDGYEPFRLTELAADYIRDRASDDKPFCLFVSWGPPHCPYLDAPQDYLDMYPPGAIRLKPNAVETANRETIAGYYAHITALDDCFGRVLAALDAAGAADNTIVVFTSDHGDMLFSQNRGWKSKPWAESVMIPLVVRWPGQVPAGGTSGGLVSLVDVMPSLLSLAGVEIPDGVEGLNLSALILGDESASQNSVLIGMPVMPKRSSLPEWRGIVTRQHTYARFRDRPWVLYDDESDPFQLENLVDRPEHKPLMAELDAELTGWLKATNDSFETSKAVADRFFPEHVDNIVPCYENETIVRGKMERKTNGKTE